MRVIALLLAVALSSEAGGKKKPPKPPPPPTQPDIVKECLTVAGIRSYNRNWTTDPHISADVINVCAVTVQVTITVAYYNAGGVQFGNGFEFSTILPGTTWRLYHTPIMESQGLMWRGGKIVNVTASAVR